MTTIADRLHNDMEFMVSFALQEDLGQGDITAELIPEELQTTAHVICREPAILCGQAWFDEVFRQLDTDINIQWHMDDACHVETDARICSLQGPARPILTGERTALNFLQTLSATATTTRSYVDAVAGTNTSILDTRKTLPGFRSAQRYAVTCGGGSNHRMGLYDAILIKENHIVAAGTIEHAVSDARHMHPGITVEVETEDLQELEEAIHAGADVIMLDNFDIDAMREAIALNKGRAKLEASGNVSLGSIRDIAMTGVDFISIGALTKHINAVDFSMRIEARFA